MNSNRDDGFRRRIIFLAIITALILLIFLVRLAQFQLFTPPLIASSSSQNNSIISKTE